jgi:hypothetical protein
VQQLPHAGTPIGQRGDEDGCAELRQQGRRHYEQREHLGAEQRGAAPRFVGSSKRQPTRRAGVASHGPVGRHARGVLGLRPLFGALAAAAVTAGRTAVRTWVGRLVRWRVVEPMPARAAATAPARIGVTAR